MFKELCDRLAYALIAAVVGGLVGSVLWFMLQNSLGVNITSRRGTPGALIDWIRYGAGISAVLGFVLKDKAADWIGASMQGAQGLYDAEQRARWPMLLVVLAILAVASFWYFKS